MMDDQPGGVRIKKRVDLVVSSLEQLGESTRLRSSFPEILLVRGGAFHRNLSRPVSASKNSTESMYSKAPPIR